MLDRTLARLAPIAVLATVLAACAADTGEEDVDDSSDALTSAGGRTTMHYLGSGSFLRQCAGDTLGCGKAVSSISDDTPYFSAPRTWPRSTCGQWYTFKRSNGACVEAQRQEVSDSHNYIEGNPGVFEGLGLTYSDGRSCAGSGQATVTISPGRHCDD